MTTGYSFGVGGRSGTFDPAELPLTGWWRAERDPALGYDGAGLWKGTKSAGSSGSRNLTEGALYPAAGNLNGMRTAVFNGSILTGDLMANLIALDAWSFWMHVNVTSIATNIAGAYNNDGAASEHSAGDWGIYFESGGGVGDPLVLAYQYDGADNEAYTPIVLNRFGTVQSKYDGANLWVRYNRGPWVPNEAGAIPQLFDAVQFGRSYDNAHYSTMTVADIGFTDRTLSNLTFDQIVSYNGARYSSII